MMVRGGRMPFDWYAATIPESVSDCMRELSEQYDDDFVPDKPVSPYKEAAKHSETGIRIMHGGCNPLPFLFATGTDAPEAAEFIRRTYPTHRVSRADVAHDFRGEGGFDAVRSILDPIARKAGASVTFIGDPSPDQTTGRTLYYGSAKSDVRICVYEKGLLERSRGSQSAPESWYRVELRVRPRKERKAITARLSASQLWGMSRWTSEAAPLVLGHSVAFHPDTTLRRSSADRAVHHMLRQYARSLRGFVDRHGREMLDDAITSALDHG